REERSRRFINPSSKIPPPPPSYTSLPSISTLSPVSHGLRVGSVSRVYRGKRTLEGTIFAPWRTWHLCFGGIFCNVAL
ncbi:mCG1037788, partial [Mus musculus]